ncbi:unnamed protein product [Linum trigynum]|uniref:Uncharacterized protein n=1 Tax=Linum trigynum TaxID=586398 RepID=A0AAV2FPJ9_9ROSI
MHPCRHLSEVCTYRLGILICIEEVFLKLGDAKVVAAREAFAIHSRLAGHLRTTGILEQLMEKRIGESIRGEGYCFLTMHEREDRRE